MRFRRFVEARSAWEDQADDKSVSLMLPMLGFSISRDNILGHCKRHGIKVATTLMRDYMFTGSRQQLEALIDWAFLNPDTRRSCRELIREARSAWENQRDDECFVVRKMTEYIRDGALSSGTAKECEDLDIVVTRLKGDVYRLEGSYKNLRELITELGMANENYHGRNLQQIHHKQPLPGSSDIQKLWNGDYIKEARSAWEDQVDDDGDDETEASFTRTPGLSALERSELERLCLKLRIYWEQHGGTFIFSGRMKDLQALIDRHKWDNINWVEP